jgi:hypothetical protein
MPYTGIPSMEFKDTANAEAIVTLMAANFEHMWFISWRRPSLPQERL